MIHLIYPLNKTSEYTYEFTTNKNIKYVVYLTSLSHLSSLFTGQERITEKDFYYLVIDRKGEKTGGITDVFIKRTIALTLFNFFTQNKEAIVVFNYTNADNRILGKRAIFKKWYEEYSQDTLYKYYQHDFANEASICALYRRFSSHINFAEVEEQIRKVIIEIAAATSKQ